jgi:hypothetical protein
MALISTWASYDAASLVIALARLRITGTSAAMSIFRSSVYSPGRMTSLAGGGLPRPAAFHFLVGPPAVGPILEPDYRSHASAVMIW